MVEVCRRVHAALHRNVCGTDHDPLQPLYGGHLPPDSPLCHRRLRDRNRRELSRRIRSVDAARTGNEKLLPRLLQRVRVRRHLPGLTLSGTDAAGICPRLADAAAPAAGRTAFPAYLAGSRGSNGRTAAAGLHGLLCQLGHRGGIHGSPDQIGAIRHRRYAAASLSGYSPPRTRHGRRDRAARPDSAFLFPGRHLCRRHQTPLHPLL